MFNNHHISDRLMTIEMYEEEISDYQKEIIYHRDWLIKELSETNDARRILNCIISCHRNIDECNYMIDRNRQKIARDYEKIMQFITEKMEQNNEG